MSKESRRTRGELSEIPREDYKFVTSFSARCIIIDIVPHGGIMAGHRYLSSVEFLGVVERSKYEGSGDGGARLCVCLSVCPSVSFCEPPCHHASKRKSLRSFWLSSESPPGLVSIGDPDEI